MRGYRVLGARELGVGGGERLGRRGLAQQRRERAPLRAVQHLPTPSMLSRPRIPPGDILYHSSSAVSTVKRSGLYLARGGHVGRAARHGDPSLLEQGGVDVDALDEGGGAPDALAAGAADHQRDLGAVLELLSTHFSG